MVSGMNISYDSYRIFYYVAKYQNVTQAAGRLMNSQPNITRAIKNLEGALGCQLFLRSNRGVRLTPEGEKLYAHVAPAVEHIQAGEEAVAADQSLQSGIVTVAASEIAGRPHPGFQPLYRPGGGRSAGRLGRFCGGHRGG